MAHTGIAYWIRVEFWSSVLLLSLCAPLGAQQPMDLASLRERFEIVRQDEREMVRIGLKDILAITLQRSTNLKAVSFGEDIALRRVEASRQRLHPTLTNEVEYGRGLSSSGSSTDTFLNLTRTDGTTLSSTLSQSTAIGLSYSLSYAELQTEKTGLTIAEAGDDPEVGDTGDPLSRSALTAAVSIPLIKDRGFELNNLPIRQKEVLLLDTRWQIRQQEQDILLQIATIYWDMVGLQESLKVSNEAVGLSGQLLADNKARLQAGVLAPSEVQVTETQLARERQSLLEVKLAIQRVEDQVRAALNLEDLPYGFIPQDVPRFRRLEFRFEALLPTVLENHPRYQRLKASLLANSYTLQTLRNEDATDLELDLSYTFNGYNTDYFGGTAGFAQSEMGGYTATLTWTLPLFDHDTGLNIQAASLERQQIEVFLQSLRSELSVQLQSLLRQIRLAEEVVNTARIARELAEKQQENEIERFRLGQSTSFQVSQTQQVAAQARRAEILALIGFEKNHLSLLTLGGDLYEHFQLQSTVDVSP